MQRLPNLFFLLVFVSLPLASAGSGDPLRLSDYFEICFLGCALFYADIVSDVWSLARFWQRKQMWFFGINASGIAVNTIASAVFGGMGEGSRGFFLGVTQLHVLISSVKTLMDGRMPRANLMVDAAVYRGFELIEASCSFLTQGYTVMWDVALSNSDEMQLRISVMISLLSLANGLTLLDKPVSDATEYPIIKSIVSCEYIAVCLFRISELVLSFGSLFLFQLATRPYGGFIALATVAFCVIVLTLYDGCKDIREAWKYQSDRYVTCAILVVSIIPNTFFLAAPVVGKYKYAMKMMPNQIRYFAFRLMVCAAMSCYLRLAVGTPDKIWDIWSSYTDSAIYAAYAVGASALAYPAMFVLMRCYENFSRRDVSRQNYETVGEMVLPPLDPPGL